MAIEKECHWIVSVFAEHFEVGFEKKPKPETRKKL